MQQLGRQIDVLVSGESSERRLGSLDLDGATGQSKGGDVGEREG